MSASPREVREANEQEALIALLAPEVADRVRAGEYTVQPGRKPDRPWVRRADNGRIVQGQSPNTPSPAETGKRSAIRQSASYRQALESFLPMFKTDNERQSFERLVEVVMWAVEGAPQTVEYDCPHPETCPLKGRKHHIAWAKNPDAQTGFKMIELLAGKAAQTATLNVNTRSEVAVFEHRTLDVNVYDISRQTAEQRRQMLIDAGVIESEWVSRVVPESYDD